MNTPMEFIQKKIFSPISQFQKTFISKSAIFTVCNKLSNLIFKMSDDIPFIMLFFNAVSILSSHLSQIGGLKKSDRENKDYLITQEKKELFLDTCFTIIPPFLLKNFLATKFYSGEWTTKSARKYLIDTIAPTVGASKEELYNIANIKGFRQSVGSVTAQITDALKKSSHLPDFMEKGIELIEQNKYVNLPDPNSNLPAPTLKEIAIDFDKIRKNKFKGFYKGSAENEIIGQIEGIIIIATLAYTILSSSIITPILKNKMANKEINNKDIKPTKKKLFHKKKKKLEAPEVSKESEANVFDVFSYADNTTLNNLISNNKQYENETHIRQDNPFSEFNRYDNINNLYSGMRI